MTDVSSDELAYTLGLISGEGSFFITFVRDDRYNHNVWYSPKMSVSMGEYSRELLKSQQALYGLGTVTDHPKGYAWTLSSRSDCHELRRLIDGHIRRHENTAFVQSQKYQSYQKWCEALEILQPDRSLSESEVIELADLREGMNNIQAASHISPEEIRRTLTQE
ncbi:LAGLIDADG family homing endonuclease [Halomicroarcula sp. GCM10025709]|uniref:LAGLIDADG family homing endonuclease n=1 Tax=Haloarcula TaxID=2237 RepID=UPI0024C291AB|nr:LAGLIDADG family homing endonuclease [Halomicroarcula sp. YJ-61-S]